MARLALHHLGRAADECEQPVSREAHATRAPAVGAVELECPIEIHSPPCRSAWREASMAERRCRRRQDKDGDHLAKKAQPDRTLARDVARSEERKKSSERAETARRVRDPHMGAVLMGYVCCLRCSPKSSSPRRRYPAPSSRRCCRRLE